MIMAKGFWKRRFLVVILIVAGSILILFPAVLPDYGFPSSDERTAEGGQLEETTSRRFSHPTEESAPLKDSNFSSFWEAPPFGSEQPSPPEKLAPSIASWELEESPQR